MTPTPCPDCQKPIDDPQTCEVCGKVTCTDCACYDEDDDRVWCVSCFDDGLNAEPSAPTAQAVLYQLASLATIAERGGDTEKVDKQLRAHLTEFNSAHLRALAAALSAPAQTEVGVAGGRRWAHNTPVFYVGPRQELWGGPYTVIASMHSRLTRITRGNYEVGVPHDCLAALAPPQRLAPAGEDGA